MAFYECKSPPVQRTLLWENAAPSTTLGHGDITLDDNLSFYKYLEVWYKDSATGYNKTYVVCPIAVFTFDTVFAVGAAVNNVSLCRTIRSNRDGDTIYINDCYLLGTSTTYNDYIIITEIFGIKN